MRSTVLLFTDIKETLDMLTDEQAGQIFKAIIDYQTGNEVALDGLLNVIFAQIKRQIDYNNEKYDNDRKKRSEAGKKGMQNRWHKDNTDNNVITKDNNLTDDITNDNGVINVKENDNKHNITVTDTDTDTDINNIYIVGKPRLDTPKTKKDDQNEKDIQAIVDYLNEKTQSKYSAKTNETRKSITARLKDGYTVDDFKAVIDSKVKEWFNDADMRKYLRPSTLFRPSNFESYLNEANRPAVKSKNQFNNFEQNQYDYEELERRLTANVKSG